jgi:hypothetical protein
MPNDQTTRIRALNDALRTTLLGGKIMMTQGVSALSPPHIARLIDRLRTFDQFEEENDPYGEHDFGAFDEDGQKYFWKIDYYDPSLSYHSDDAADPEKTVRVLTLMRADEY